MANGTVAPPTCSQPHEPVRRIHPFPQIVSYTGQIGGDHAVSQLRAELFDWPITMDLEVKIDGPSPCFYLHHFDGESWNKTSNGYTDGAAMVACWESVVQGGAFASPMSGIHQTGTFVGAWTGQRIGRWLTS